MVQYDADKLNTLLHWMKGFGKFSRTFNGLIRDSKAWCPFTHRGGGLNPDCYNANPRVQSLLAWSKKYTQCAKFLDADRYAVDELCGLLDHLASPERIEDYVEFRRLVSEFRLLVEFVEPQVCKKLNHVSCEECERLDEGLVCFSHYSFRASVVMAVSAVELRIVGLIQNQNKRLYDREFSRYTLGQLIQVFDENQYKARKYARIKTLMPAKHKPLLSLLNQYRIFSVHPKGEDVTAQVAESILLLSCAFLFDKETSPYSAAQLKCK